MDLADQVAAIFFEERGDARFVDVGGLGAGVVDRLAQLGWQPTPVDSGSAALNADKFYNRRSEMWWKLADWVKKVGCIPSGAELRNQLLAPMFMWVDTNRQTRFKLESKDDMKSRGIPSPDHADALALTFSSPVPMRQLSQVPGIGVTSQKALHEYDPLEERD